MIRLRFWVSHLLPSRILLWMFAVLLTFGCGSELDSGPVKVSEDRFSGPIPSLVGTLQINETTLIVEVILDQGTGNEKRYELRDLIVDNGAKTFSGRIPEELDSGIHAFQLDFYYLDGHFGRVNIVIAGSITAEILKGRTTLVGFGPDSFSYPDNDGDGATNLLELEIGTDPNDPMTRPFSGIPQKVDQKWEPFPPDCVPSEGHAHSILQPTGQEFIPTQSPLVSVDLGLVAPSGPEFENTITVNIREATIDGSILATATAIVMRPEREVNESFWQHIDLPSAIEVLPGATYVIEPRATEAGFGWEGGSCAQDGYQDYPGGAWISYGGIRVTSWDKFFRTYTLANTVTLPGVPTGLIAIPGDSEGTIIWDAVPNATAYNLYMASVFGVSKTNYSTLPDGMKHIGVTSPFTHTGLTNGKTYYFVVTAVNANGESIESSKVSATPTDLAFVATFTDQQAFVAALGGKVTPIDFEGLAQGGGQAGAVELAGNEFPDITLKHLSGGTPTVGIPDASIPGDDNARFYPNDFIPTSGRAVLALVRPGDDPEGAIVIDFISPTTGVGAYFLDVEAGVSSIEVFDGLGGTGNFLGKIALQYRGDNSQSFGGVTANGIRSAIIVIGPLGYGDGVAIDDLSYGSLMIKVAIDIKAGSFPTPLTLAAEVVPMAILSSLSTHEIMCHLL